MMMTQDCGSFEKADRRQEGLIAGEPCCRERRMDGKVRFKELPVSESAGLKQRRR